MHAHKSPPPPKKKHNSLTSKHRPGSYALSRNFKNLLSQVEKRLTDHESNDGTKKSEHPEGRSEGWNEIENTTQGATYEKGQLPAKLVIETVLTEMPPIKNPANITEVETKPSDPRSHTRSNWEKKDAFLKKW